MKEKTGKKKAPYKRGCTSYCYMLFRKYILVWQVHLFNENFTKGAFMAVLKNKTQRNFTMISNSVLRDKELSMKDRGVLCTICSLPDGWEFSIAGLSSIVPDGVDGLYTGKDTVFQSHFVQLRPYRSGELIEYLVALHGGGFQFLFYLVVLFRMFVLEAQVFQFCLDFVQAEAVGERGINIECFACNLELLVG